MRQHPRRGYDALAAQGGFPPEMLDVVLHHHEFLDGTGYPDGLSGNQISDIVRLTTIVDIYAALVEKRAYRLPFTHVKALRDHGRDGRQARPASAAGVPPGRVRVVLIRYFLRRLFEARERRRAHRPRCRRPSSAAT